MSRYKSRRIHHNRAWKRKRRYLEKLESKWRLKFDSCDDLVKTNEEVKRYYQSVIDLLYKLVC